MSTSAVAVYTSEEGSGAAGRDLGQQLADKFSGSPPDAVLLFASSRFEYEELLRALHETCKPGALAGASSAGEFVRGHRGEGTACAFGIRSDELRVSVGVGRGISQSRKRAVAELVEHFRGLGEDDYRHRSAVVMTDALAGHADELVETLTVATAGRYQFAGGGAGDDAHFRRTHVFCGTEAVTDAVVALEFLSERPIGIGVGHGWSPASQGFRVTEVDGARLVSLNGMPAGEVCEEHAAASGQQFDRDDPQPFFLHNILGIETDGAYRLRVPLILNDDDSITCAAEVPLGATIYFMKTTAETAITAAAKATEAAVAALHGAEPGAALFFDCVATRLRMGEEFGFEIESVARVLGDAQLVGCNTYGQIARAAGQFGGFHNCTAVTMVLPR